MDARCMRMPMAQPGAFPPVSPRPGCPDLHRDWLLAIDAQIRIEPGLTPPTSAPGEGLSPPTAAVRLGSPSTSALGHCSPPPTAASALQQQGNRTGGTPSHIRIETWLAPGACSTMGSPLPPFLWDGIGSPLSRLHWDRARPRPRQNAVLCRSHRRWLVRDALPCTRRTKDGRRCCPVAYSRR